MIIDCKIPLKNIKGKNITDTGVDGGVMFTIGDALCEILLGSDVGGKMKLFTLAQKLSNYESVEVDASDLSLIKETVKNTKVYGPLIAGQCEILLEDVKEESNKTK